MTTASVRTESIFDSVKSVVRGIWAAFLTAALTVSFVISFTTIIYGGSLAPLLETGLGLSLLGAALMCGVGGFFYSFRGTICHPQDVTAIVLAVSASAMAEAWPPDQGDGLMATIAILIAVTTAFSGVVALAFAGPALAPGCAITGAAMNRKPAANSITTDNRVRIVSPPADARIVAANCLAVDNPATNRRHPLTIAPLALAIRSAS